MLRIPASVRAGSRFMSSLSRLLLVVAVLLAIAPRSSCQAQPGPLRAGAFAMDVTPLTFPISVNGNMRDHLAGQARDPLHARCLVLDDGQTRLALVVVDSCMLPRELLDDARQQAVAGCGIPADRILISATHAHSCPTATPVFQSDPDAAYVKFLAERIAAGIQKANALLAPAEAGWAVGRDETQVFNRRWWLKEPSSETNPFGEIDQVRMNPGYSNPRVTRPAGPVDPQVTVLSVRAPSGRPLALFANYSLHYVGGTGPGLSADYFGAFSERIGQLLLAKAPGSAAEPGPAFVGAMFNGTSGDVNNVNFSLMNAPRLEPFEQIRLVADSVARAAADADSRLTTTSRVTLRMAESELELAVRKPSAADIDRARNQLEQAGPFPYSRMPDVYARETLKLADYPATVKLRLQAIRIGELGIVSIPCEVFTEIGLELKQRSPLQPTCVISLANGYNGYLPTPEQHERRGYETWRARSSYLETTAAPKIVAALLKLLEEVRR